MTLEHILTKLISFRTITGCRPDVESLYDWIKDTLQPVPLHVRTYQYNGLPSLVITPTRRKRARLWLVAHVDVVAGPDELFTARRDGTRLVGRGAIDMKFAVACYTRLLLDLGIRVRDYDIGVILTPDEEWGGASSVKYLLEKEKYIGDVAFLPDGSGWWKFEERAKGMWELSIETIGVAAHGSKPWLGCSAIAELVDFVHELEIEVRRLFVRDDPEHWYTTMNVSGIQGGVAYNVVAPRAHATVDVRYVHRHDRVRIGRVLKNLQKKYPHTTYCVVQDESPYGIVRKNGYIQEFARSAKALHEIDCDWIRAHGSSDARFFNAANIPTILIGPHGGGSHSDSEWVDLRDLERYYDVLTHFVEKVARR